MNPRNIIGHGPLSPDMLEKWTAQTAIGMGSESAVAGVDALSARSPAQTEELALVARARVGDQEAFGVLVRLHQRQVYSLAVHMLRNPEEASEAAQEVFLAAWQGLHGFRGDARFSTWLHRIAYNYCLRMVEQRRRDSAARAELTAESAREHHPAMALSARHAEDAERSMRERVRGEIANLPPKYRAVLVLRHLQELSYEEMAEVMRVPIGTVKTQLFRARSMLKDRLEGLGRVKEEGIARAGDLRAGLEAGLRGILERGRELPHGGDE